MAYDDILPAFKYTRDFYPLFKEINKSNKLRKLNKIEWHLIGSRWSGKTVNVLKFLIECGIVAKQFNINVKTDIVRWEPKGAKETYNELLNVGLDIYNVAIHKGNTNITDRFFKVGNNEIKAIGIVSNRTKQVKKLGLARKGIGKDLQINFFEEVTELESEKEKRLVTQATGGAKLTMNIFCSNPWILSHWYVSDFNRQLPFNRKVLMRYGEQKVIKFDKKTKTLKIYHITNHRINHYLSEGQHQELIDLWQQDPQLAEVADLGMYGASSGLVYAKLLHTVLAPSQNIPVLDFRGAIDWGTSTNEEGSGTGLLLGRVGFSYSTVNIDDHYFHSNAKMFFKSDEVLVNEMLNKIANWYIKWRDQIQQVNNGYVEISYDYAAAALGGLLETLARRHPFKAIFSKITFSPCVKYDVPVRIDIVKMLLAQGRIKYDKDKETRLHYELEVAMYEDTKLVKGRATRVDKDNDLIDCLDYFLGRDTLNFANTTYLKHNKML